MKRLPVSLVEMFVLHPPKGLEGWRFFREEVGGHATECIVEGGIWLPPGADPQDVEMYLTRTQDREYVRQWLVGKADSIGHTCREVYADRDTTSGADLCQITEVTTEVEEE